MSQDNVLLKVESLKKYFQISTSFFSDKKLILHAVDDVSFEMKDGEILGIVGESGCGKSTLARVILALYPPTSGKVFFNGINIFELPNKRLREIRRQMQVIFQDPYASLNPRMSVENIVGEPLIIHGLAKGKKKKEKVAEILEKVGLSADVMPRYPHEFSGGQRQRIGIARAIIINPKLIIADEPVSALDVSIQAQVINLLINLKKEMGLSYIIISHDLAVIEHLCNRIIVMYLGKIVEIASDETLYSSPYHPYTKALLSSIPVPDPDYRPHKISLHGEIPSPVNPPKGCRFHTRCPYKFDLCEKVEPKLIEKEKNHWVSCHLDSLPASK